MVVEEAVEEEAEAALVAAEAVEGAGASAAEEAVVAVGEADLAGEVDLVGVEEVAEEEAGEVSIGTVVEVVSGTVAAAVVLGTVEVEEAVGDDKMAGSFKELKFLNSTEAVCYKFIKSKDHYMDVPGSSITTLFLEFCYKLYTQADCSYFLFQE